MTQAKQAAAAAEKIQDTAVQAGTDAVASLRQATEDSVKQVRATYEQFRTSAEDTTDMLEDTFATATKGAADLNRKVIEAAQANVNSAFDFARDLLGVKTLSDAVELQSAFARKQFETTTAQVKEIAELAGTVSQQTAKPLQDNVSKSIKGFGTAK